jgi:RNA polymerase sigma-70 factor (ECF subfamily)
VLTVIDKLGADDRELVKLIVWDGLTHAEVATLLGCSTNAVGIRWHRPLKRLRSELAEPTNHTRSTLTMTQALSEET